MDDIKQWTVEEYMRLKRMAEDRNTWRRHRSEWSSAVSATVKRLVDQCMNE